MPDLRQQADNLATALRYWADKLNGAQEGMVALEAALEAQDSINNFLSWYNN